MSWPVDEFATGWPRAAWPGSLADQVRVQLQRRGDSLLIPGVGIVDGFSSGTYSDSTGATPAVLDYFLGRWVDAGAGGLVFTQATTPNKSLLTKRVNLFTGTVDLGAAPWVNAQGVSTYVEKKIIPAATTLIHGRRQTYTQISGRQLTISALIKAGDAGVNAELWTYPSTGAVINLSTWAITSVNNCDVVLGDFDADGYRLVSYTFIESASGVNNTDFRLTRSTLRDQPFAGDGSSGYFLKNPQMVVGALPGRFQRVSAATDYDTVGFPYRVRFSASQTLSASIPSGSGYADTTIISARPGGQITLTGQNLSGVTHTIGPNLDLLGRIYAPNGSSMTAAELALYQRYMNNLAGVV